MKKILIVQIICVIFSVAYSQSPGGVNGQSLWLTAKTDSSSATVKQFNFNPVLTDDFSGFYKNLIVGDYSLLVVFKSDTEAELPILTLCRSNKNTFITNKSIHSDKDIVYKKVDSKKGILLSYTSSVHSGRKNNGIKLEKFYGDDSGYQQLIEVVFYPRILNAKERNKVETYLSLKYGLSLEGKASYINSSGHVIWDCEKNKPYNNRVTGIGRDDAFPLYQKQSGNALHDGIYIGLGEIKNKNRENENVFLNDTTFTIWGDNDGTTILEKSKSWTYGRVMKRLWKMQTSKQYSDVLSTQLIVKKEEIGMLPFDKGESLWLAINKTVTANFNYNSAHYIKAFKEDKDYFYFNNVNWDDDNSKSDLFTFVTGPEMLFGYDVTSNCDNTVSGIVKFDIAGGLPPYDVKLRSVTGENLNYFTSDSFLEIMSVKQGNYDVTISDKSGNTITQKNILVNALGNTDIFIESAYILDRDDEVIITPIVSGNSELLSYEWLKGFSVLGNKANFVAKEPGDYLLRVSNSVGCAQEIPFKISSYAQLSEWSVYPNPVKHSQSFNIQLNLSKESEVIITINSIEGKQSVYKNLGRVKNYKFINTLNTSGVYTVSISINGILQTAKLIVE